MLIAQITDTHIVDKNEHWLSEPLTRIRERLIQVISYLNALSPRPDVVLLTGDVTDKGTPAAYDHFRELTKSLSIPLYLIPGNHDCRQEMRKAFSNQPYMPNEGFIQYVVDDYPVRLIGLDTHVEGEAYGHICEERFTWLQQIINRGDEKPTLIFMHHAPVKTGTKIFDAINCLADSHLEHLISKQNNFLGIIAGHYHQLCLTTYGGKTCFIAPSVAPISFFAHPQDDYVTALELEDPAITLHKWQGGSVMASHVIRLKEQHHRIDWKLIKRN